MYCRLTHSQFNDVQPVMSYSTIKIGCQQCGRSEAALPREGASAGNGSACQACPARYGDSAQCESGQVVVQPGWWRAHTDQQFTKDTRYGGGAWHRRVHSRWATLIVCVFPLPVGFGNAIRTKQRAWVDLPQTTQRVCRRMQSRHVVGKAIVGPCVPCV